jgi:mRNA interferase MazF
MKRGEVYYIKSNYSEQGFEQRANRPAVIVSNDKCNEHSGVLEVVFLTTKTKKQLPTHVAIWKDRAVESIVMCEQITSVDISRFSDFMGQLSEQEMQEVDKALAISVGLPIPEKAQLTLGLPVTPEEADQHEDDDEDDSDDGWMLTVTRLQAERDLYEKLYTDLLNKLAR